MDSKQLLRLPKKVEHQEIGQLAATILEECLSMEKQCQRTGTALPSLAAGTVTDFWSQNSPDLMKARTTALGLLEKLTVLLQGPHDYLHEFVAPNWDHGALYAFLQSQTLEHIASSGGRATITSLSVDSGIPEDKLERILGLLQCKNIVHMRADGIYTLTAVSEDLLEQGDFRAWIEFQLFETRVASAHLSEALANRPNAYGNGPSGFKQGWGTEMYDWHASHPDKGDRFRRAMKGVIQSLDPAGSLIKTSVDRCDARERSKVVEIGGRYGFASIQLALEKPDLSFEIRCDTEDFLRCGKDLLGTEHKDRVAFTHVPSLFDPPSPEDSNLVLVYVIRNLFWNWLDEDAIRLLRTLLPTLRATPSTRIIVTDGVSPLPNEFPPHIEIGYRRRDITMMTMHNVKQRTQTEWLAMFSRIDPSLKVNTEFDRSSHVCKGLWELYLEA